MTLHESGLARLHPLVLALWLALAAGVLEGIIRLIQSIGFGQVIGMSPHVIWTAPVANLGLIGIPALLAWGVARSRTRVVAFVPAAIAVAGLALMITSMHKGVTLFLSVAIGWRLSAWLVEPPWFPRFARRTIPVLAGVAVLGGLTIAGWRTYTERRALAEGQGEDRLNVLLIILDTVRGYSMSLYGYDRPTTPFLEEFAREGVRFDRAMAPSSWTLPSHASMFTGQMPRELKVRWRTPVKPLYPFVSETFGAAGYRTGGFIANASYMTREHGLAHGFSHYEDYLLSPGGILNSSRLGRLLIDLTVVRRTLDYWDLPGRKYPSVINRQFLRWVDDNRGDGRPFFAFLNYFDAHQPYLPPEPYRGRFVQPSQVPYRPRQGELKYEDMSPERIRLAREHYDGAVAWQDDGLRQLMAELENRGLLDRTLVIITSDHGEQFGEHQKMSHANSLYRQLLQVPLLIRLPGRAPAAVIERPVSLVDLPRTMLGLAGLADSAGYPGSSLARYWSPGPDLSSDAPVIAMMFGPEGTAWSLMADGYHYIEWYEGETQLYHMSDEQETRDLATLPEFAGVREQFANLKAEYSRKLSDQGRRQQ